MSPTRQPLVLIRTLTCVAATGMVAYQVWWSTQPDCPIRQLAEIAASMDAGDEPGAPPRPIPLGEILVPYLVGYWGLLITGGLCIIFPNVAGRWMVEDETRGAWNSLGRRGGGDGAAPVAWLVGWGIVFVLPGILMACARIPR